jgi:hypothetical protein
VIERFVPADPRWTRPYIRVGPTDGKGDWYCWATERGGGWTQIEGPPRFALRSVGYLDAAPPTTASDGGSEGE